jgi:ACS family glucarate transporter-like MFS transporter
MNRPVLPDRPTAVRYGVLAWLCSLSMITYIDRVCIMQVAPDMQHDLGLSKEQFSWAFAAFALAYALCEVPTGWLGDRIGPRKVLSRIVMCWLSFTALTGLVWDRVSLVAVRALFGAGEAGAYPNMARASRNWFPYRERGRAQGLIWTFGRLGGAVAPVLIVVLAAPFGWRGAFVLLGALGIFWVAGFHYWFRDRPDQHPGVNPAEQALIAEEAPITAGARPADLGSNAGEPPAAGPAQPTEQAMLAEEVVQRADAGRPPDATAEGALNPGKFHSRPLAQAPLSWPAVLSSPTLWALSIMYFCSNSGWSFFITWVPEYMKSNLGLTGTTLHLASGAPLFFGAIGCYLGGLLTDRQVRVWGRRWGRTLQGVIAYACGGTFFLASNLLTQHSPALAFTTLCAASFVKDFGMAASWSTTIDIGHRYSGSVAGVMNTIGNLGTVVSPPVVAWLALALGQDGTHDWSGSLFYYAGMFYMASLCWLFVNPRRVIVYAPKERQMLETHGVLQDQ